MQSNKVVGIVTEDDLTEINACLKRGSDCRIQRTKHGIRIIEDRVKVVKVKEMCANGQQCAKST